MMIPIHAIIRIISLTGSWLSVRMSSQSKEEIKNIYTEMSEVFVSGVLHSSIENTYSLDQVAIALAHTQREGRDGKIIFSMKG